MPTYFIAGIDTDTGKTFATGLMARYLLEYKKSVITQKFAQTGCKGISEDILMHREIMGMEIQNVDKDGTTCPYVFDYPASPHLAAQMQNQEIDIKRIEKSSTILANQFDYLLLEGVGGMHVPITMDYSLLDFMEEKKYPVILVTSSKLGSINHTLLSLEIAKHRQIPIKGLIYNQYPANSEFILNDSIKVFKTYLEKYEFDCPIIEIPELKKNEMTKVDFGKLFFAK
ncbi:dethiobiotin synthase [Labilibaculum filiforme]|uniref:ATP-dependent dethiobiotin synthetase BioD n=1 Tax=Labilibaculum filiforme TaxID=1940526 RepID=A0A2N3HQJ9_9BACT|nr:dethiobiotin synthase [Labilibaculum filiforme]PKQ60335.1 dethiobiotin synthase [Labilibaculum filiforme]